MAVTITTVGTGISSNVNRVIDRDPNNGRLWTVRTSAGTAAFWYSDNNGANWAQATGSLTDSGGAVVLFVDLDGGLNVAYSLTGTGSPAYRRGVVSGTTITWSAALDLPQDVTLFGDIVAFRNPTGGWFAAITGRRGFGDENYPWIAYVRVTGTTPGSAGIQIMTQDHATVGVGFAGHLDFHHTGDGKTVQAGTPHLYVSYKQASSQTAVIARIPWSGNGYSFSGFGWGTGAATNAQGHWYPMVFDGIRIVFLAFDNTADTMTLYDRDAGNTQTLTRATSPVAPGLAGLPEISYDRDRNIHVVYLHGTDQDLYYNKWTRATDTWGAWTLEQAATATAVRLRRGWSGASFPTIEGVYTDATNLSYQEVVIVNAVPNAPGLITPADGAPQDVANSLAISWNFNDPDQGDTQSAYTIRRQVLGVFGYWNGSAWVTPESGATKIASAVTSTSIPSWASDLDPNHHYSVKTWDSLDQVSPWSSEHLVIPSAKDNPTITDPASDGASVTTANYTVVWTVATQTKYRVRVVGDSAGSPNVGVVEFDSGVVNNTATRSHQINLPTNSVTRHIELTTWNDEGLQSTIVYRRVSVAYTPPGTPTLTLSIVTVPGAIRVTIDNPTGGEAVSFNDLFRRVVGDTGNGIRVATGVAFDGAFTDYAVASGEDYEYRAKALATTGAASFSAWED